MELIDENNIERIVNGLAKGDPHLSDVLSKHGVPPLWGREPGFATLLHIILEQQVSLASAKSCFDKLAARTGGVTPQAVLDSTAEELRRDGFSRQKATYARHLADAVAACLIDLSSLGSMSDSKARSELMKLKGVGDWTADIYLLMAMRRPDIMPKGDLALHIAWERLSGGPRPTSDEFQEIAKRWSPYRSVAARLLWHFYLSVPRAKR